MLLPHGASTQQPAAAALPAPRIEVFAQRTDPMAYEPWSFAVHVVGVPAISVERRNPQCFTGPYVFWEIQQRDEDGRWKDCRLRSWRSSGQMVAMPGATADERWFDLEVFDPLIARPGVYRLRIRWRDGIRMPTPIESPWVAVDVREHGGNQRLLADPESRAFGHYRLVADGSGTGAEGQVGVLTVGRAQAIAAAQRWFEANPVSTDLRRRARLARASHALRCAAARLPRPGGGDWLDLAGDSIAGLEHGDYRGPTGGLGSRVLAARLRLAVARGDVVLQSVLLTEYRARYPQAGLPALLGTDGTDSVWLVGEDSPGPVRPDALR